MDKEGKLIIFSAPSGAGKTTIVHHLIESFSDQLELSVSATSRKIRGDEAEGVDYYFISVEDFKNKIRRKSIGSFCDAPLAESTRRQTKKTRNRNCRKY